MASWTDSFGLRGDFTSIFASGVSEGLGRAKLDRLLRPFWCQRAERPWRSMHTSEEEARLFSFWEWFTTCLAESDLISTISSLTATADYKDRFGSNSFIFCTTRAVPYAVCVLWTLSGPMKSFSYSFFCSCLIFEGWMFVNPCCRNRIERLCVGLPLLLK